MKAEFLKDENGNIWFYYATGIQTRARYKAAAPTGIAEIVSKAKTTNTKAEEKEKLEEELDEY